jgi:hypothetical protein
MYIVYNAHCCVIDNGNNINRVNIILTLLWILIHDCNDRLNVNFDWKRTHLSTHTMHTVRKKCIGIFSIIIDFII